MDFVWLLAETASDLVAAAKVLDDDEVRLGAVVLGDEELAAGAASIVETVKWVDTGAGLGENFTDAVVRALADVKARYVLGVATPAVRAALGKLAASQGMCAVSNVTSARVQAGVLQVKRTIYDDFVERDEVDGPACLLVDPLLSENVCLTRADSLAQIEKIEAADSGLIEVLGSQRIPRSKVEDADIVIGVGLGVAKHEMFEQVQALAQTMHAELGATMNLVEHTDLMPGARHIGISGMRIAPKLYLALGVSGAAQHLVGVRNAEKVVVVNKDPKAKFFNHADYGIVGTVEEVVPALMAALG